MLYLIYDPSDSTLTFELLEPIGLDLKSYSWFNLKTLNKKYNCDDGNLVNTTLDLVLQGTCCQVITTFDTMPTATDLRTFIESSPELFL